MSPDICPNCGAKVPANAKCCPECGADDETGWSEQARYDSLDLPDDNFDYDDFVKREFGSEKPTPVPPGIYWFWWLIAILAALAFVLLFVF